MKVVAVLAGTHREFINFVREFPEGRLLSDSLAEAGDSRYQYVGTEHRARGMEFSDYRTVGTFWNRWDAGRLYDAVCARIRQP